MAKKVDETKPNAGKGVPEDLGLKVKKNSDGTTEVTMTDGRIAKIRTGKFKDSNAAIQASTDTNVDYMTCLMAVLVTFDGKLLTLEEIGDLSIKDGLTIQAEFSKLNF